MAEYIEREAVIAEIVAEAEKQGEKSYEMAERGCDDLSVKYTHGEYCYSVAEHIVKTAPAADVEPVKHGEWLNDDDEWKFYKCSICGNEAYWDTDYGQQLFDFCPHCGAKMDGKEVQENE